MATPARTHCTKLHRGRAFSVVLAAMIWLFGGPLQVRASDAAVDSPAPPASGFTDRIVHNFDFNERALGNTEDVPMYWSPMRLPGFPHYANGVMDFRVGHAAPPSFHLRSEGRNVAYVYSGAETRVRPNSEYRIEGFIRSDGLKSARACLSAHWVDKGGQILTESLVRSRFVGGTEDSEQWIRVDLRLPPAPLDVQAVGLVAWVLQEPQWNTAQTDEHRIWRTDVEAGAWFDDIRVVRLPRVDVSTSSIANILLPNSQAEVRVLLADPDDTSLEATLTIADFDDRVLKSTPVRVIIDADAEPRRIPIGDLPPGLYHATLEVFAGQTAIMQRTLDFAVLAPSTRTAERASHAFGIVLDSHGPRNPAAETALLRQQRVRAAKIPLLNEWGEPRGTSEQQIAFDRMLRELTNAGFILHGVLTPAASDSAGPTAPSQNTLLELLAVDGSQNSERLTQLVAPTAEFFQWWQVGTDQNPLAQWNERTRSAVDSIREALHRVVTLPQINLPLAADVGFELDKINVDGVTFSAGYSSFAPVAHQFVSDPSSREAHVAARSVFIAPLAADEFERLPRIADWARRIVLARHHGVETIFVPQTWRTRLAPAGAVTEPDETFIVLRTILDMLGDASPGPRLEPRRFAPGVECLTFRSGDESVLVLWDRDAGRIPRRHSIQIGPDATSLRQVDLWGGEHRLEPSDVDGNSGVWVELTDCPVFIQGVPTWLTDLQNAFALAPEQIEAGRGSTELVLEVNYNGAKPVVGSVVLRGPQNWELTPNEFDFQVSPDRKLRFPFTVQFPPSEPAGRKTILASIRVGENASHFDVELTTELAIADLDVSGSAVVQGGRLVLRHTVTNRSKNTLSFRGAASAPGRGRQYRPISELRPGDTQTVEYRFPDGAELIGRRVRLVLHEINDGPRLHVLELTVP